MHSAPSAQPGPRQAANEANAQNARHSTGPKTPEGKARAAANSRTHGLCAKDVIISTPEEHTEFSELLTLHLAEIKPNGSIEQVIFDQMIADTWNLRRIRRLETALNHGIDPLAALDDDALQSKLERIARHRTRIERSYFKSLKELSRMQTERVLTRCSEQTADYTDVSPLLNTAEFRRRPGKSQNFKTNPNSPEFKDRRSSGGPQR